MSDYWLKRNKEMEHIQSMFDNDAQYNKALKDIYTNAESQIKKEIESELQRFASKEELSMSEAMKKIDKQDVEAFSVKAKKYVEQKDFSPQANDELRVYNVKMRMNRLELLNQNIKLELIAMADEEDKLLTARLDEEFYKEVTRQAGILGENVPSQAILRNKTKAIVTADFKGADFSSRIWSNRAELESELSNVIRRTVIQGEHPRVGARKLRGLVSDNVKNKRHAAERIAITESGRVQIEAQRFSYEQYGIDKLEVICEPDACEVCSPYDGKVIDVDKAEQGYNIPIFHPHCRCSTASYVERE